MMHCTGILILSLILFKVKYMEYYIYCTVLTL